jgi:hypothetical protein
MIKVSMHDKFPKLILVWNLSTAIIGNKTQLKYQDLSSTQQQLCHRGVHDVGYNITYTHLYAINQNICNGMIGKFY